MRMFFIVLAKLGLAGIFSEFSNSSCVSQILLYDTFFFTGQCEDMCLMFSMRMNNHTCFIQLTTTMQNKTLFPSDTASQVLPVFRSSFSPCNMI